MNARPEDKFEVHGYYEELVVQVGDRHKLIGTRRIPHPGSRKLGVDGAMEHVITEPIEVQRGHKTVAVAASKQSPLRCTGYAQAVCGRALVEHSLRKS